MDRPKVEPPHVPYRVKDLVGVTSVEGWSNPRVKVIGVLGEANIVKETVTLREFGFQRKPPFIMVDIEAVATLAYLEGRRVSVIGDLYMREGRPFIMAASIRDCVDLSVEPYTATMELLKNLGFSK